MVSNVFVILLVVIVAVVALLFVVAKVFSSIGKKENARKRYAAVMIPGVAILAFVISSLLVNTISLWIVGLDLDEEAPLKHRYGLFCYTDTDRSVGDIVNGRNFVVVDEVGELYMDGDKVYGWRYDVSNRWTKKDFVLDMKTGQHADAPVEETWKLVPVKQFQDERMSQVTKPLGWFSMIVGVIIAFFASRATLLRIRRSN